jgi:hypothetical protein
MRQTILAALCGVVLTGTCAMAQTGADYLDITRVHIRGDKTKEFQDAIKKMVEVERKYKGDRWIALSNEYGDANVMQFSATRANLAAVETDMEAFGKALKEGMGPMGDKLLQDLSAFSVSFRSDLRHRRWDLSVHAPSSLADMYNLVAHTRWIRALRVDIKPGHNMDYAQAWMGFKPELERMDPPVTVLVSESVTGTPAMYFAVYCKSFAEMDMTPALQRALSSSAYMNLMKEGQTALDQSNWDILKVRPELSNAPDEVVAADPAFWKPKPAAAAAKPKTDTMAAKK